VAKRRVPLHLVPSDLWVYAPGAKSKGRGKAFLEEQKHRQEEIRQARRTVRLVVGDVALPVPLDHPLIPELLPLQALLKRKQKRKQRPAVPRGRPRKVALETVRALKRLGRSDAELIDQLGISRWTVRRYAKDRSPM
jgi:hypothetical protein